MNLELDIELKKRAERYCVGSQRCSGLCRIRVDSICSHRDRYSPLWYFSSSGSLLVDLRVKLVQGKKIVNGNHGGLYNRGQPRSIM